MRITKKMKNKAFAEEELYSKVQNEIGSAFLKQLPLLDPIRTPHEYRNISFHIFSETHKGLLTSLKKKEYLPALIKLVTNERPFSPDTHEAIMARMIAINALIGLDSGEESPKKYSTESISALMIAFRDKDTAIKDFTYRCFVDHTKKNNDSELTKLVFNELVSILRQEGFSEGVISSMAYPMRYLSVVPEQSFSILVEAFKSDDSIFHNLADFALSLDGRASVEEYIKIIKDYKKEPIWVRTRSANSLYHLVNYSSVEELEDLIRFEENYDVRRLISEAILHLKEKYKFH